MVSNPDDEFAATVRDMLREYAATIPVTIAIGITGTRKYPADAQSQALRFAIGKVAGNGDDAELHHGCCSGIDETAHHVAYRMPRMRIFGHPGPLADPRNYAWPGFTGMDEIRPNAVRNLNIVRLCSILIACPLWPENDIRSQRSGTWQTIRYARRARKPIILITPTGRIMHVPTEWGH